MRRIRKTELSALLLLLPTGTAQACTPAPERPTGPSGKTSRLTIAQTDGGYIIRASASGIPAVNGSPCCAVSLGSSVRFDRDAILPSSTKEIEHGEIR
jgi:hypothetical protein